MRLLYLAPAHTVNMLSARFEFEFLFTIYHFLFQIMSFSVFDKMSCLLLFSFRWFTHIPRNHLSGIAIATDKREPIRVNKKTINLLEISEFYYWNRSKYSKRWKKTTTIHWLEYKVRRISIVCFQPIWPEMPLNMPLLINFHIKSWWKYHKSSYFIWYGRFSNGHLSRIVECLAEKKNPPKIHHLQLSLRNSFLREEANRKLLLPR